MSALVEFLHARLNEDEAWVEASLLRRFAPIPQAMERPDTAERLLADIAAKRRIVELHRRNVEADDCWSCGWVKSLPCDTVRALALPYADHPDYRQEWRP